MLYLGSDHRGFRYKEKIKKFLNSKKIAYQDIGPHAYDKDDDYPDFAAKVAREVSKNPNQHKGILICGSGVGVCVAANKLKGVIAGTFFSQRQARDSKADENTNIVCLSADYTTLAAMKKIVGIWLKTPFSNASRHRRRVGKIRKLEK